MGFVLFNNFLCNVIYIIVRPFMLFLLAVELSVLLRFFCDMLIFEDKQRQIQIQTRGSVD